MTRSRISMIVAAGALVLVGLLAAALFSPSGEQPSDEPASKKDDVAKVEPTKATQSVLGNPVVAPAPVVPTPVVAPAPVPAPAPAPAAKEAPKVIDYTIKPGDMISKIASKHGVKKEDIYALNPGLDDKTAAKIRVGEVIKVPTGPGAVLETPKAEPAKSGGYFAQRTITAQPGDTAFQLAVEHYGSISMYDRIIKANPGLPWKDRLMGGEQVVLPEWGTAPAGSKIEEPKKEAAKPTVARDSLIPARR